MADEIKNADWNPQIRGKKFLSDEQAAQAMARGCDSRRIALVRSRYPEMLEAEGLELRRIKGYDVLVPQDQETSE